MRASVAVINMAVGAVYVSLGCLILLDLKQGWHLFGFSRFGAGLAAVAFTCGVHHFVHGQHVAFHGHDAGALDLLSVLVGLPVGLTWLFLRLEALAGGRGERMIIGTPGWLLAVPTVAGMYLTALAAAAIALVRQPVEVDPAVLPHVALVGIYLTIGWMLMRTQLLFHRQYSGWSLSGCCLAGIFLTCSVMHAVLVLYSLAGRAVVDVHGFWVSVSGVPAGLYFLSVVRGLVRAEVSDWNVETEEDLGVGRAA